MPSPSPQDPITCLLAIHAETRRHLQTVADTPSAATALAAWLDGPARAADDILEQQLFPALIESMAGSDAVCLKGMTSGLAHDRAALDRRWHQSIRPALARSSDPMLRDAFLAWADAQQAWLTRTDEELLPMAARLLDDEALAALAARCAKLQPP